MRQVKVVLDFKRMPVAQKIAYYRNVLEKLTNNRLFPSPDIPLPKAKAAIDSLEASFLESRDGGHTSIAIIHQQDSVTTKIFTLLAKYVDRIADGDEPALLSSGFHASRIPTALQKAILSVIYGLNSGDIKLIAKAVDKAGSYIWQFTKDSLPETESEWIICGYSTQATFELSQLEVDAKYYFRVAAVTPEGITDFSAPIVKLII